MLKLLVAGSCLVLAATAGYAVTHYLPAADDAPATKYCDVFAEVPLGEFDPAMVPQADGIVWYGTWEAAMAEKERTGKPVMLHFGSPRAPTENVVCVPGTW
jgi:hypothetical protein